MPGRNPRFKSNNAWALLLAFAAVAFFIHFAAPAAAILGEAVDVLNGKYAYCPPSAGEKCVSFIPEKWLEGIAGAIAVIGFFAAFAQSAATAWTSEQKRYAVELDRNSAFALAAALAASAVLFVVEAWKWSRLFSIHENALFNVSLAALSLLAALAVAKEALKLSKGEAVSVEMHRHAQ